MSASERFEGYMAHLAAGLGHVDRHAGLKGYCTGLMLPLSRKSVEPMAARVDPLHASARHQSLHHFVAQAEWSDMEMLRRVAQRVVPKMELSRGGFWIVDDTGFPKQGKHSVGWRGNTAECWVNRTIARWRSASPWRTSKRAYRWRIGCIYPRSGQMIQSGARRLGSPQN